MSDENLDDLCIALTGGARHSASVDSLLRVLAREREVHTKMEKELKYLQDRWWKDTNALRAKLDAKDAEVTRLREACNANDTLRFPRLTSELCKAKLDSAALREEGMALRNALRSARPWVETASREGSTFHECKDAERLVREIYVLLTPPDTTKDVPSSRPVPKEEPEEVRILRELHAIHGKQVIGYRWRASPAQGNVLEQVHSDPNWGDGGPRHIALCESFDTMEGRIYPDGESSYIAAMYNAMPFLLATVPAKPAATEEEERCEVEVDWAGSSCLNTLPCPKHTGKLIVCDHTNVPHLLNSHGLPCRNHHPAKQAAKTDCPACNGMQGPNCAEHPASTKPAVELVCAECSATGPCSHDAPAAPQDEAEALWSRCLREAESCRPGSPVAILRAALAAARREGAEKMRERAAAVAQAWSLTTALANAIRALDLAAPGAEGQQPTNADAERSE
jgi:hypothetical protein